jgi:hypothetical protein
MSATKVQVFAIISLSVLGIAERIYGGIERISGHPEAVQRFFPASSPRGSNEQLKAALRKLAASSGKGMLIAYFGDSDVNFQELGLRGWAVGSPSPAERAHVPETILAAAEWRRVGPEWIRDRIRRGMTFLVLDRSSKWNNEVFLRTLIATGLRERDSFDGHIVYSVR